VTGPCSEASVASASYAATTWNRCTSPTTAHQKQQLVSVDEPCNDCKQPDCSTRCSDASAACEPGRPPPSGASPRPATDCYAKGRLTRRDRDAKNHRCASSPTASPSLTATAASWPPSEQAWSNCSQPNPSQPPGAPSPAVMAPARSSSPTWQRSPPRRTTKTTGSSRLTSAPRACQPCYANASSTSAIASAATSSRPTACSRASSGWCLTNVAGTACAPVSTGRKTSTATCSSSPCTATWSRS
jgi:hypothetical protein